jgi:hypothetical protein
LLVGDKFLFKPDQTAKIAKNLYAIELGGWGSSETTAGMTPSMLKDQDKLLNYHPPATAVGYNQLLEDNTFTIVKEDGPGISKRLTDLAQALPQSDAHRAALFAKADMVTTLNTMLKNKSLPNTQMPDGQLKDAIQALNLDPDIGPILQANEFGRILHWFTDERLKFSELNVGTHQAKDLTELVQQTEPRSVVTLLPSLADKINARATDYDKLSPADKTQAINFLLQHLDPPGAPHVPGPPDPRVLALQRKLETLQPGVDQPITFTSWEKEKLTTAEASARTLGLDKPARKLADKLAVLDAGKLTPDKLEKASFELRNLVGPSRADAILLNPNDATSKHLIPEQINKNRVLKDKNGFELLTDLVATIETNAAQHYPGNAQLNEAFRLLIPTPRQ